MSDANNQTKAAPKHSAMHIAVGLLARRDYSRQQIQLKLQQKQYDADEIETTLDHCQQSGYLDDARFAALLLKSHISKGHGVNKIRQSMQQKGLSRALIEQVLLDSECDWFEVAKLKAQKKYGEAVPLDHPTRAKCIRYLMGQGFDYEQANYALAVEVD
ncbi:regulatory protein RecX [Shewanella waksmanii]|uniref:regulatory protein RecX n=1 Tax=Shewanella waksmanii TaxID=213783 RepID=UPI0004B7CB54|nr:regulatory protein RecX [Shewanella waksmanii]